jgi:replicative DNA helicase
VLASIERAGELERAGGRDYLLAILQNVPTAANVEHYAGIVRDRSVRRRLAALGMRCGELAFAQDGRDAAALLAEATREVESLSLEGSATDDPVPLQSLLASVVDEVEKRAANPDRLPGLSTGLGDLDAILLGLHPGEVVVVAGATSQGKTTLGVGFAIHAAMHGVPSYVVSLEMKDRALAKRAIANVGGVSTRAMRTGKLTPEDWESMARGLGRLNDAAPILVDPHPLATIDRIRARARRAKRKHGIGLIVIDYLQLIEGQGDNANARITAISRGVKLLAMELDVPVVLLSQLNRELAKRPNKRPLMSDLRDSGAVEQDADVIVFVYRDEYYNPDNDDAKGKAEIIVAKNREGEVGTVYANFDGRYNRFASTEWRPGVGVPTGPAYRGQDDGL